MQQLVDQLTPQLELGLRLLHDLVDLFDGVVEQILNDLGGEVGVVQHGCGLPPQQGEVLFNTRPRKMTPVQAAMGIPPSKPDSQTGTRRMAAPFPADREKTGRSSAKQIGVSDNECPLPGEPICPAALRASGAAADRSPAAYALTSLPCSLVFRRAPAPIWRAALL